MDGVQWHQNPLKNTPIMQMPYPTVSILTRVCESELPYLSSFIEHHHKVGVSSFHVIIQCGDLENKIKALCRTIQIELIFWLMDESLTPDQCLKVFEYTSIKTEYTFLVDVDEFFYSPVHQTIPAALVSLGRPDWIFPFWIMAPSDFNSNDRQWGFLGHIGKHIVKSCLIKGFISPHAFLLESENSLNYESQFLYRPNDCFVIHYWGRTFKDCLLKMVMHRGMGENRQTSVKELVQLSDDSKCANRLKLLAFLTAHPRYIKVPDLLANKIDYELEKLLIKRFLNKEQVNGIEATYLEYKSLIKKDNNPVAYPGKGELSSILKLLPD